MKKQSINHNTANDGNMLLCTVISQPKKIETYADLLPCPKCGAVEVDAMTPRTVYACGSSDYDQRPNTFNQSEQCRLSVS